MSRLFASGRLWRSTLGYSLNQKSDLAFVFSVLLFLLAKQNPKSFFLSFDWVGRILCLHELSQFRAITSLVSSCKTFHSFMKPTFRNGRNGKRNITFWTSFIFKWAAQELRRNRIFPVSTSCPCPDLFYLFNKFEKIQ